MEVKELKKNFVCFRVEDAYDALNYSELSILGILLDKIESTFPDRNFICISEDEPYAQDILNLIQKDKVMSK